MSLTSKVGIAKTGTMSLRATVPEGIVAFLDLQPGDKLDWKMEIINDERVTVVKKAKSSKSEALRIAEKYAKKKET